jgi:hypothetical protein
MRAIDADALFEELNDLKYTKENPSVILSPSGQAIYNSGIESAMATIIGAPTIDPVKRAKWVQPDNGPMGCLVCSNCLTYPISKNGRWHLTKYCPDCGAKMEE